MEKRICKSCKKEKNIIDFTIREPYKGNLRWRRICKKCFYKNPKRKLYKKLSNEKCRKEWIKYLNIKNPNPKCEICGKRLNYLTGIRKNSVHFDHKKNNLPIKLSPFHFIRINLPTLEKIKLWELCDFGILCCGCNFRLPTDNRKEWLNRTNQYVFDKIL